MRLKKFLVRTLLSLYPAAWRKEYGEEMRSMLLAQPLTAPAMVDVFLYATRENLRRPDPWRIAFLINLAWRTSWLLRASFSGISPEIWAPFLPLDRGLFLAVAFAIGCWVVTNEGSVERGMNKGFTSTLMAAQLAPLATSLLLLAIAPDKTTPDWALDRFDNHQYAFHYTLLLILSRALAAWCGALLGHVIRKRAKSRPAPQPSR